MQNSSKQKVFRLAAGSLIAACSLFGTAAFADDGGGGGKDPAPNPPPGGPTIPKHPGEGLPIPLPGGGG